MTENEQREAEILAIARRETQPELIQAFEPITHGFIVAVAGMLILGIVAVLYLIRTKALKLINGTKT